MTELFQMTAIKPSMVCDLGIAILLGNEFLQTGGSVRGVTLIPHFKRAVLFLGFVRSLLSMCCV